MRLNPDDKTVAAMDLLVPRVGELIGGSQREERLPVSLPFNSILPVELFKVWQMLSATGEFVAEHESNQLELQMSLAAARQIVLQYSLSESNWAKHGLTCCSSLRLR